MPNGYTHLTREQHNHNHSYHGRWTQQAIADSLRVSQGTVSRELSCNRDACGDAPRLNLLADGGYHSAASVDACEAAGIDSYIAKHRDRAER